MSGLVTGNLKGSGAGRYKATSARSFCHINLLSWILPGFRRIFLTDTRFLIPYTEKSIVTNIYILKYPLSVETSSILFHVFLLIYYTESCQTQKKKNIDGDWKARRL